MSGKYDIDRDLSLRGLERDTPTTEEFQAAHIDELKRQLAEKDKEIERLRKIVFPCKACGGLGVFNDAEPGDISFKQWECPRCNGFDVEAEKELAFYAMNKEQTQ